MSGDIVVVGQRVPQPGGSYNIQTSVGTGKPGFYYDQPIDNDPSSPNASEPMLTINIGVDCSSEAECRKAKAAAAELVRAAITVLTECEKRNLAGSVTVLGHTTSLHNLYHTIRETKYTVTDKKEFGNGGGGAADHVNRRDTIYYGTIGTPAVNGSSGVAPATGYHRYTNGIIGLVLHEAVHLTKEGCDFYLYTVRLHDRDTTRTGEIYKSTDPGSKAYSDNNEAFVNELARQLAPPLIGYNLPDFNPGVSSQPVDPADIYREHMGSNP